MLSDPTQILRNLMQAADIDSYRLLAERSGVSRWQIQQLRKGHIHKMRLVTLTQIAAALEVSFPDLYSYFQSDEGSDQHEENKGADITAGQSESTGENEMQIAALQTLESWLVQWPTIARRAQDRPDLSAAKILPFVRPVEQLVSEWGVEPIAAVDSEVVFDPTHHQLVGGQAEPGDLVRVTHAGSTHHNKLLHRAKVKPI